MIGLDKRKDVFLIQTQVGMGDEFSREAVDARQTPVGSIGQHRQFLVIAPGEVQLHLADVTLDDVLIVEEPLDGGRRALSQLSRFGQIQTNRWIHCPVCSSRLSNLMFRRGFVAHLMISGETLGILLDLLLRERTLAALRLSVSRPFLFGCRKNMAGGISSLSCNTATGERNV